MRTTYFSQLVSKNGSVWVNNPTLDEVDSALTERAVSSTTDSAHGGVLFTGLVGAPHHATGCLLDGRYDQEMCSEQKAESGNGVGPCCFAWRRGDFTPKLRKSDQLTYREF